MPDREYDWRKHRMHHSDNPKCKGAGFSTGCSFAVTCERCKRWMAKQENAATFECTFEVYRAADGRVATTPRIGKVLGKGAQIPVGRYRAVLERLD